MERNAQLVEIRKKDLPEIFRLWLEANHVDQDLMKQGAIATAFAFELRNKTPSPELVDTLWRFVADETQSRRERVGVLGIFAAATTKEAVDFLVRAATTLQDKELRQSAMHQMMMVGDLWGDGTYHEERSPALERAWRETQDPDLLIACAVPMAEIGAPQAIASLLAAAIAPEGRDDMRKRSALSALDKVYGRNAIPPIAALFASQQAATPAAALAGRLLARIGNDSAANALVTWLRNAEDGAASLVPQLVQQTRTPEMLDAWTKAAEGNTAFRSERVREAIRDGVVRYHQNHRSEK